RAPRGGVSEMTAGNRSRHVLENLPLLGSLARGLVALMPLAIVCGMFAIVYALIPNTRVQEVPAVVGGVTAGLLWVTIGKLFTSIVLLSTRLTVVYAGFAIFVAALIWIYFSWLI